MFFLRSPTIVSRPSASDRVSNPAAPPHKLDTPLSHAILTGGTVLLRHPHQESGSPDVTGSNLAATGDEDLSPSCAQRNSKANEPRMNLDSSTATSGSCDEESAHPSKPRSDSHGSRTTRSVVVLRLSEASEGSTHVTVGGGSDTLTAAVVVSRDMDDAILNLYVRVRYGRSLHLPRL